MSGRYAILSKRRPSSESVLENKLYFLRAALGNEVWFHGNFRLFHLWPPDWGIVKAITVEHKVLKWMSKKAKQFLECVFLAFILSLLFLPLMLEMSLFSSKPCDFSPFYHVRMQWKGAGCEPGRGSSPQGDRAGTLILDFSASTTGRNNLCCL